MSDEDLVSEREPLGRIELHADLGQSGRGGRLMAFDFPPQDHGCKVGRGVDDPVTRRRAGTVTAINDIEETAILHRTKSEMAWGLPGSLIPDDHVTTDAQEESLFRIGEWVADHGLAAPGPYQAARDLLRRVAPRARQLPGDALRGPRETALEAARKLALTLDDSSLPPGTGKTYKGARMILDLVRAGRKIGVTANSHSVIGNMLDAVHVRRWRKKSQCASARRPGPTAGRHASTQLPSPRTRRSLTLLPLTTSTLWAGRLGCGRRQRLEGSVHVLVIDEAGQMSLRMRSPCRRRLDRLSSSATPSSCSNLPRAPIPPAQRRAPSRTFSRSGRRSLTTQAYSSTRPAVSTAMCAPLRRKSSTPVDLSPSRRLLDNH
ncbi:MAG: hypothetical protein ACREA0_11140 [bacterium]